MELFAAALATILVLVSLPGARAQESNMREDVRAVAPAPESYTQNTVRGDLWKRPELSTRDRSLVTLAALIARAQTAAAVLC